MGSNTQHLGHPWADCQRRTTRKGLRPGAHRSLLIELGGRNIPKLLFGPGLQRDVLGRPGSLRPCGKGASIQAQNSLTWSLLHFVLHFLMHLLGVAEAAGKICVPHSVVNLC
jgi:hypothetical protein